MSKDKPEAGDEVEYTTLGGKKAKYVVQGPSQDGNSGVILKGVNDNKTFAVSGDGMKRISGIKKSAPTVATTKYVPTTRPSIARTINVPPQNTENAGSGGTPTAPVQSSPSGPSKFSNILRKGAGAGVAAAGFVGGAALNGLRNAGRAIGGPGDGGGRSDSSDGESSVGLLVFITLAVHIFDWATGFSRPGFIIYIYPAIAIFTFFFIFDRHIGGGEAKLIAVMALAYILPYIPPYLANNSWSLSISGLLFWLPILPIYLASDLPKDSIVKKISLWYTFGWCVVALCFVLVTFAPDQDTKMLVKDPMAGVRYVYSGVGSIFSKASLSIGNTINRAVAMATGQAYDGQEESRAGIYVENVHPLESRYNNMSNVFVEATIKAENVKEFYNVNTICYIDGIRQGTVNPTIIYDVTGSYENIIGCTLGQLKEGTYDVKVRANFVYETSSDITYTFVNSKIRNDQYSRLGIDPTTIATYTGGPVELGLPAPSQPLPIEVDSLNNAQLSTYPFGVSLKNKWPQGKVMRGLRYILDVPIEIKLTDCSRDPISVLEPDPTTGRNTYTFEINSTNAGDMFDAVRCRMNYVNVNSLLGADLKSVKTFAAKARYEYAVEGTTTIVVEKS